MTENEKIALTEKRLRAYPSDLEKLNKLDERLKILWASGSIHAQNYEALHAGGAYSDPVSEYYEQCEKAERDYQKLLHHIEPVTRLIQDLHNPAALDAVMNGYHIIILERFYFDGIPVTEILRLTHWSRTAFYARRYDLIQRAQEYMRL